MEQAPRTVAPLEGKLQQDMSPERITIRGISLILCDHFYGVILSLVVRVEVVVSSSGPGPGRVKVRGGSGEGQDGQRKVCVRST